MSEFPDRPLLTFALTAFNQERFIREAVEAAFAQTYSPLEIILSDDCSQDRTFEVMQQMAASYNGPHQIVLNRNPSRRSIGGHVNRIADISRGELIVGGAGDDVSLPERTQVLYEAWDRCGRPPTSVHSDVIQIDADGRPIRQVHQHTNGLEHGEILEQQVEPSAYVENFRPIVFGCAHAWPRRLFDIFGHMPEDVIHEDNVLPFRAAILAHRFIYVNQRLVKYRLHGNNIFLNGGASRADLKKLKREEELLRRGCRNRETTYGAFLLDLKTARLKGLIPSEEFDTSTRLVAGLRRRYSLIGQFLEGGLPRKCRILARLQQEGLNRRETRMLFPRLLPGPLLLRVRLARAYAASAWNRSRACNP